ncbi:transmembrane protein 231 isoform X2 [Bacillus rossius redtenbacheri]
MVTSREIDSNHDDKNDRMIFEVEVLMQNATAKSVKLFLLFDYKLHGTVQLRMEALALVQHASSSPGTRLDVAADLRLVQKQPLSPGRDSRFDVPVFDPGSPLPDRFNLRSVLREYASRSVSLNLKNVYSEWLAGRGNDETFTISTEIQYLEETVLYRPGMWETMKWAWVQYVTIAVVVGSTLKMLKGFMLRNNIIPVMKDKWK